MKDMVTAGGAARSLSKAWITAAAMAAFLVSAPALARVVDQTVEIDKPVIAMGNSVPVYILVRFEVPDRAALDEKDRPPLNLALVLDRSGSMGDDGKIEYMREAAKTVVDLMAGRDRLAVVEYDDTVTLAWPLSPVESPALLKRIIDGLEPRGATDLTGGMMRGVDEIRDHLVEKGINRVLLLSDGLANRGITSPRDIRRLVRQGKRDGVRVTTMGLGIDYDEDLMQDIAESAGGNYYYIESPTQMARIFRREMHILFLTAARDASVRFTAGEGVGDVQVFGFEARTEGRETVIELDDFHAGESLSLLLRLEVEPRVLGPMSLGRLGFSYLDVAADEWRREVTDLTVRVSLDKDEIRRTANPTVVVEAALMEAEQAQEESLRLWESGEYEAAEELLEEVVSELLDGYSDLDDVRIEKKIEALRIEAGDMSVMAAAPAGVGASLSAIFSKRGKQRLYQAQSGNRGLYMLSEGDSGLEVERLQETLAEAGYWDGDADGNFSDRLTGALEAYQSDNGLSTDGIAGPATLRRLGLY